MTLYILPIVLRSGSTRTRIINDRDEALELYEELKRDPDVIFVAFMKRRAKDALATDTQLIYKHTALPSV